MLRTDTSTFARCTLLAALALTAAGCVPLRTAALHLWELAAPRTRELPSGPGASRLAVRACPRTPLRSSAYLPRGMRPEALIALGGLSRWSARNEFAVEISAVLSDRRRDDPRSTRVVNARVDLYRRIVSDDAEPTLLEPRIGLIARELSLDGTLIPGTRIQVVYRETDERSVRNCEPGIASDAAAGGCDAQDGDFSADASTESRILSAVQIGVGTSARRAYFLYDESRRVAGFYTRDGRPLERSYLRYPVEHTIVTSRYSSQRPHPILKKRKPHYGIDFAAPRGTPVVSVADGEVVQAKWLGQYGRQVGIRHGDGTISRYSHLDRIAPGIAAGVQVRKGDFIGNVGASGLATGPHLHFAMVRNGKFVDPATAANPPPPMLAGAALHALRGAAAEASVALAVSRSRAF